MIRLCRRLFRLFQLLPWLSWMAVVSWRTSHSRDQWKSIRGMARYIKIWGRGLLRIFKIKLTVHPAGAAYHGGLVVSNHMGYVDILVHSALWGMRFCPKADVRSWPVLGWYAALTHPIWIDRRSRIKSKEALEEFSATLKHGVALIVYPEGTSTDGKQVLPFKTSSFELAASGGFPIQPIVTVYRVPEGADSPCWYTDIGIIPHLWQLVGIPEIRCDVYVLPQIAAEGRSRKELAELTCKAITEAHAAALRELAAEDEAANRRS